MHGKLEHMRKVETMIMKRWIRAGIAALACAGLAACGTGQTSGEKETSPVQMTKVTLEADTPLDGSTDTGASSENSWLPSFALGDGSQDEAMEELNDTVQEIGKTYQEALSDDTLYMSVSADDESTASRYLVTIKTIEEKESLTGKVKTERNLTTIGCDMTSGSAITPVTALESTGMTGVELSQKVEELYGKDHDASALHSTEMQGFVLDESGKVSEIYMKLGIEEDGSDGEVEQFFVYDPETGTLSPMDF